MSLNVVHRLYEKTSVDAQVSPIKNLAAVEQAIDAIIGEILKIALRRCCPDMQSLAHDFVKRKQGYGASEGRNLLYLNDPYLKTLAIAGEAHMCAASSRRQLATLFALRDQLVTVAAQSGKLLP